MTRFLFAVWPFAGHLHPQISIAAVLRARGHQVAFYTGAQARPLLEDEGFDVFPFHHINEERVVGVVRDMQGRGVPSSRPSPSLMLRGFREWLVETAPDQVADLSAILKRWQPDALVAETAMWGPTLVLWETERIPVAISSTLLGCLIPGPDAPPWGLGLPPPRTLRARLVARAVALGIDMLATSFRRSVDRVRARYCLPPLGCSVNAFTARLPLYLVPSIPDLDYNRRDLPPSVHYVGPCVWNKPSRAAAPAWLEQLPADQPWIHVTEGTLHLQDPILLRAAARGLAHRPVQAILTTGPQRDPARMQLGPAAPNIRIERWVSHSDLLPRCAVLVTTGGSGTIMAGLQAGVPLVVVPTHWDKADNAQRVVEVGAGVRLPPNRCTPRGLWAAIEHVLTDGRFRSNAQRLARRLADAPGPRRAAELSEALASVGWTSQGERA